MKKKGPSKAETALLPPFQTLTREQIVVPATPEAFAATAAEISAAGVAGFDTEARPTFHTGDVSDGPHVVQFAITGKAFIFQTCRPGARECLIDLLRAEEVLKAGFGLHSDHSQVQHKFGVRIASVLDLDSIFRKDGYGGDMGVRAAIGVVLGQRFHKSKKITTSNWSLAELSPAQLLYAANDAYAALMVLRGLQQTRPELLGGAIRQHG